MEHVCRIILKLSLTKIAYIAQNHLWFSESVSLLWLGLEWQGPQVVCPKVCIRIPVTHGAYRMKWMSLHPKRLWRTREMRTICATCYNLFKHIVNFIGSDYQVERLIFSSMVTWTPTRDRDAALVTSRKISHDICLRTFKTLLDKC